MANGGVEDLTSQIIYNLKDQQLSVEEKADFISSEYDMSMADAALAVQSVQTALENATGAAQAMADTQ